MNYTLTAQVNMLESETTLAIVMPSADATEATLVKLEDDAVDAFGNAVNCIKVMPGQTITPIDGNCYELEVKAGEVTEYKVNSPQPTQSIAVFTKNPAEIEVEQGGIEVEASSQLCNSSYPKPIAGYVPGSDVFQHAKIDLDQKAMEDALQFTPPAFTTANERYSVGANSMSKGSYRAPACGQLPPRPLPQRAAPATCGMCGLGPGPPQPRAPTPRGRSRVSGTASVRIYGRCCCRLPGCHGATVAHLARP